MDILDAGIRSPAGRGSVPSHVRALPLRLLLKTIFHHSKGKDHRVNINHVAVRGGHQPRSHVHRGLRYAV